LVLALLGNFHGESIGTLDLRRQSPDFQLSTFNFQLSTGNLQLAVGGSPREADWARADVAAKSTEEMTSVL